MRNTKGFTMVELLVVLLIVGILAAIAAPIYFAQVNRSKMSEAVATMSMMRQAEREYTVNHPNTFLAVDSPYLENEPGDTTHPGLGIKVGVAQYFSRRAFNVTTASAALTAAPFTGTGVLAAQDFVITANGGLTEPCTSSVTSNCAVNGADVNATSKEFIAKMDNSGRVFVSYDNATSWNKW